MTTGEPTRPDPGGQRRRTAVSANPMSEARAAGAQRRADVAMSTLHPGLNHSGSLPTTPATLMASTTEGGFRESLHAMFGAGSDLLAQRLLALVPASNDSAAPFAVPLVLATALRSVGGESAAAAASLADAVARGERSTDAFRLGRVLAATAPGTQALGHLMELHDDPPRLAMARDELALCSALEQHGLRLDAHSSPGGVVRALQAMPEVRMSEPIGHESDAPLQLLAKALQHAHGVTIGATDAVSSTDRAAYVAWKKGGFTTSGRGTDFNQTIGRMHKFATYVERAEHGPRTLRNLLRDAGALAGRSIGIGKSPLTTMRHGTLGADLGLLTEEAAEHRRVLGQALGSAVEGLLDELRDPSVRQTPARRNQNLARAAVLDLWRETDRAKLPVSDVIQRAATLAEDAGAGGVHGPAIQRSLRDFTRASRTHAGAPAVSVGIAALEAAGAARARRAAATPSSAFDPESVRREIGQLRAVADRTPAQQARLEALQGQRRDFVSALVAELKGIQTAQRIKPNPLFRLSDLKALFGARARPGPAAADAQGVMHALARAKYESTSTYSDGSSRGLGVFGALPLALGGIVGLPFVYPVARAESGKRATVGVGISSTGGRLFIGTERTKSGSVGVGAGWAAPPLVDKLLSTAVLAEATVSHGVSHGEGAVIMARGDVPGWNAKLPYIIDFMFEQSRLAPGPAGGRAADAAELWARFSDHFGDDPHVVVGWTKDRSSGTSAQLGASAIARAVVSDRTAIGPGVTAAVRVETGRFERSTGAHGTDIPVSVRNNRVVAGVSASLTETAPLIPVSGGPVFGVASTLPLVGASLEWNIAGGMGVARLGRLHDGQLSAALCHRELLFQKPEQLISFVNLNRARWEEAMVALDPAGATTPPAARERLNGFLEQVASAPRRADRLHGQMMSLAPAAAERINLYEARANTLRGAGDASSAARPLSPADQAECAALQAEAARVLHDDRNWIPTFLYAAEVNQAAVTTGLSFGVRAVNQEQVRAVRATVLTVPSAPDVGAQQA